MSVQTHPAILDSPSNRHHQPSPRQQLLDIDPNKSRRHSINQPSRSTSPSVNIRPSSRSEKLLRDTLRRAEEHDRAHERPIRDEDGSDCDCDDIDALFWKSTSTSSVTSADFKITRPSRTKLVRNNSLDQKPGHITSPSPGSKQSFHCSPKSASSSPLRSSVDLITPHDAVLRSRLEGVLHQATDQKRKRVDRSLSRARAHTRRDSSEDWTSESCSPPPLHSPHLAPSSPRQSSFGPLTPPMTPPRSSTMLYLPPSYPPNPTSPRIHRPHHPQSSPSFNARTASAMCRQIDGYVSFANVEGLGAPDDIDDEDDENAHRRTWFKWFGLKPITTTDGSAARA